MLWMGRCYKLLYDYGVEADLPGYEEDGNEVEDADIVCGDVVDGEVDSDVEQPE